MGNIERAAFRHRSREHWERKAAALGEPVQRFVSAMFDQDEVLSQLRPVQAVVTLLERYPQPRAEAACRRALHFGNLSYPAVRDILRKGLDLEPLPSRDTAPAWATPPRFARSAHEIVINSAGGEA